FKGTFIYEITKLARKGEFFGDEVRLTKESLEKFPFRASFVITSGNISENMSMIRRMSLNLLKQEKTAKCGIEIKRQMAGWDEEYLLQVIGVKCFS
ncbi:MAG: hypothetical protein JSR80_01215, partial [Verrucomicrobia bacterium]|nr:hypothetical protein [Verrucomicrobiota bacterium]